MDKEIAIDTTKQHELLAQWHQYCDELKRAGDQVMKYAPANEIDHVEGYRYLSRTARLGLKMRFEYADPSAPRFFEYMNDSQKFGIDNPDQLYCWANISGDHSYRIWGTRGNVNYVGIGIYAGSAATGGRRTLAHINLDDIIPDGEDRFEIILSPREQIGHWVKLDPDSNAIITRQTRQFRASDEILAEINIECLDRQSAPQPLDTAGLCRGLEGAAKTVNWGTKFFVNITEAWRPTPNLFHKRDDELANKSFGDPDLYYTSGYWKVDAEQALIIRFTPPDCIYWMFLLCNYWGESLDYNHRPVWTNKETAVYQSDGSVCLVVAASDPELPNVNWIDTESHTEGSMVVRYLKHSGEPDIPRCELVPLDQLSAHLE